MMTTEDAKARQLPGSDVYKNEHLIYLDDLHRTYCVTKLLRNAVTVFRDTITVGRREEFAKESAAMRLALSSLLDSVRAGKAFGGLPPTPLAQHLAENLHYENFKVGAGLELIAKAHLGMASIVLHKLERQDGFAARAKTQEAEPVTVDELGGWMFDGSQNFLRGVGPTTLDFNTVLSPSYLSMTALPDNFQIVGEVYRKLRNEFHLPLGTGVPDITASPSLDLLSELVELVNQFAVDPSNVLALNLPGLFSVTSRF